MTRRKNNVSGFFFKTLLENRVKYQGLRVVVEEICAVEYYESVEHRKTAVFSFKKL